MPAVMPAQIIVNDTFERALVRPLVLRDERHTLTLDSVRTPQRQADFHLAEDAFMTFGSDPSNWWLHWTVRNTLSKARTVILRVNRKNFDELQVWHVKPDSTVQDLGLVGALDQTDARFRLTDGYHFPVTLLPGENHLWAKACNRIGSMHMGLSMHSPESFAMLGRRHVLLFGLFLGVMGVTMLFGIMLFVQYRDPVYLLYLAYVFNLLLREAYNYSADFGFAPVFQRNVTSMLIATTFGLFFRQFLRLWDLNAWLDKIIKYYALLVAIASLVVWTLAKTGQGAVLKHFFRAVDMANLAFTLIALLTALWYFRRSGRARILTAAFLPLAAGFIAILLRNINAIPNYPIITQAVLWGFILEVLTLTVAFAIWSRSLEEARKVLGLKLEVEKQEGMIAVQAAEQRVKDRIARDLHDDVAASMSGIRILSQVAQGQFAAGKTSDADVSPILEQISHSAQSTLESIGDLIWAVKPNADYLNDMADRMREYAAKVLDAKGITYQLNIPRNLPILNLDIETRRNLFLIFKEAVNNAAKYSQCHEMDIALRVDGTLLWLHICDDGQGFSLASIKNGNGLGNMTRRANDIGGDLQIVSAPGAGTQIRLYLPIRGAAIEVA